MSRTMTDAASTPAARNSLDRPGELAARAGLTGDWRETRRTSNLLVLSGDRSTHRAHAGEFEDLV